MYLFDNSPHRSSLVDYNASSESCNLFSLSPLLSSKQKLQVLLVLKA